jgi:Zn-dependent peptidase ImmA (M78 family)/transcriptional regulator with XRE-family HTH domain
MVDCFNPNILTIARGSRGISQSDFAGKMKWSQGKASKVEHGLLELPDEEVRKIANLLQYPPELFYEPTSLSGFGSCCLYHRKRLTTPVRTLNRLHDEINLRRIQIGRLLRGVTLPHEPNIPQMDIDEYESPEEVARLLRATWQLPRGPILNLIDAIECAGGIVMLCNLHTPKIDAVSQRAPGLPPILFLDRGKPMDRCRFTLAHELGHIVMHTVPTPDAEREADRFAAEFLMPEREILQDLKGLTIAKAANLKLKWRVAMQALIRRARDIGAINDARYTSLSVRISQLGYRKDEPNRIKVEMPKMLQWIINLYFRDRKYSVKELSNAMLCLEDEFRREYLGEENDSTFKVIG